jgi:hypothetical protein
MYFQLPFRYGELFTKKERDQIKDLLIKYENVFAFSMKDLGTLEEIHVFSTSLCD